jgi:hypothetical protein
VEVFGFGLNMKFSGKISIIMNLDMWIESAKEFGIKNLSIGICSLLKQSMKALIDLD